MLFFFAGAILSLPLEGVLLHDGREIPGEVLALRDGAVLVAGRAEPLPLYEVSALVFPISEREGSNEVEKSGFDAGPVVRFRDGEMLQGRVLSATGSIALVQVDPPGPQARAPGGKTSSSTEEPRRPAAESPVLLHVPLETLKGFRLREAHVADDLFETDIKGQSPLKDKLYVRRQGNLLPVEGVLQSLDEEHLTVEYEGQSRKLKRQTVLGVILAPIASRTVESDFLALFELEGGGRIPAYWKGIRGEGAKREVLLRFRGAGADTLDAFPVAWIRRVTFSSDRVLFLSSVDPVNVEETPLLGRKSPFPWRRDLSATGAPLTLGGKVYRKGLGVHSRSLLEFDIGGRYRSFASTIGLDDGAAEEAGVTFRVLADGKEIFRKAAVQGGKAESVLFSVEGVHRLRLEVDYGEDGTDLGDHADWADARVTK